MAKEESLVVKGRVAEALPNAQFQIELDNGQIVLGHLAGKLRMNKINIVLGDVVDIEMSPYDITKGRITYRHKG